MILHDINVKALTNILKHTPTAMQWHTKNRQTHIIGIQLRGNMYHEMGNRTITLTEGCLFFFNRKDDFHAIVKELGESYTVHFTTYEPVEADSFVVKTHNPSEAVSLLESIERACRPQCRDSNLAMSYFYRFCHLLETLYAQSYHPLDSRISDAKAYMDLHFRECDALNRAAQLTGISRRRFNDLFKAQYGTTPNRYLTALKIDTAKKLIVRNDQPVKRIAEMSGFEDIYYFSKVFKEQTGLTPTQFRKNHM